MGTAFGISSDDVLAVAGARGMTLTDDQAEAWFEQIDEDLVEDAALHGDDMDEQTDYAHEEIARQLETLGLLRLKGVQPKP